MLLPDYQRGDDRKKRARPDPASAGDAPQGRRMRTISRETSREEPAHEDETDCYDDDEYSSDVDLDKEEQNGLSAIFEQLTQESYLETFLSLDEFVEDSGKEACEAEPAQVQKPPPSARTKNYEASYQSSAKLPAQDQAQQEHCRELDFQTPAARRQVPPDNDEDDRYGYVDEFCRLALDLYESTKKQTPNESPAELSTSVDSRQVSASPLDPKPSTSKDIKSYKQTTLFPTNKPGVEELVKSRRNLKHPIRPNEARKPRDRRL